MSMDVQRRLAELEKKYNSQTSVLEAVYRQIAIIAEEQARLANQLEGHNGKDVRRRTDSGH